MDVSAVKSYENRNPLQTVINSTLIGAAVGYSAKYTIPLQKREKKAINSRAIVNASRKDINQQKVNSFKLLKNRTPAQDAFIKMVETRDEFKYPTLEELAKRLGGEETPLGAKVLNIINGKNHSDINLQELEARLGSQEDSLYQKVVKLMDNNSQKSMSFAELAERLGDESADVKLFKQLAGDKETFKTLTIDNIVEKLGGETTDIAKKVIEIFKTNDNKALDYDSVAKTLGKNSDEVAELTRVARLNNCFVSENIDSIVKTLGGNDSAAGKEFRQIIKDVNKEASKVSRAFLKGVHKHLKAIRYTAPLLITGAAAGFAAGFLHNYLSHKTEA